MWRPYFLFLPQHTRFDATLCSHDTLVCGGGSLFPHLGQPALVVGDGDLVLLARGLVLRRHVQDAVGVDVERHVDLRHAARRWRDASQLELAQEVVVSRARALALKHLDQHAGLVVGVRGEYLLLLGGDGLERNPCR